MAQKPHIPTEDQRQLARDLAGLGVPQRDICRLIGVSLPTLEAHYRDDLDLGMAQANAKVSQSLFNMAVNGNVAAAIFWTKVRMQWSERPQQIEITGANGGPIEVTEKQQLVDKVLGLLETAQPKDVEPTVKH